MTNIPKIVIGTLLAFWVGVITNSCFGQAERTKVNTNISWEYLEKATQSIKEAKIENLKNDVY